jgi:hypothetical protein
MLRRSIEVKMGSRDRIPQTREPAPPSFPCRTGKELEIFSGRERDKNPRESYVWRVERDNRRSGRETVGKFVSCEYRKLTFYHEVDICQLHDRGQARLRGRPQQAAGAHPFSRRASPATRSGRARKTCRRCWSRRSRSRRRPRSTATAARSPSAGQSSRSWSTKRPPPICARPRCWSTC